MTVNTTIQLVASTVAALNEDLPGLNIALHKGPGYLYFEADVYQPGINYNRTHSVMVCNFAQLPFEQWVVEGHNFVRKVKGDIAEAKACGPEK